MKKLIFILSILVFATSCQDKTTYKVVGKTDNLADGTKVYLCEDLYRKIIVDSTIIKDNQFIFEGKLEKPVMRNLKIEGLGRDKEGIAYISTLLVLEPNKTIDITVYDSDNGYFTTLGTPLTTKHANFWGRLSETGAPDSHSLIEMTKENKDNAIGIFYFTYGLDFLWPDTESLKELHSLFLDKRGDSKELDKVLNYIDSIDYIARIGTKYIDIKGKNLIGQEMALSDYVGKKDVVLLHFWSWIRGEGNKDAPYLLDAYTKYKDKGFDIVEIWLDSDIEFWKEYANKNNIKWPQIGHIKSIKDVIKTYALFDTPFTLLIDKDGTIIDRNVPNTELDARLSKLLK